MSQHNGQHIKLETTPKDLAPTQDHSFTELEKGCPLKKYFVNASFELWLFMV